ncbi:cell division cycle-associated protein 2 isoform X1 [Mustela putorius furo]|uniref:Cell division cycle associated 2 n=6 Tax=Mustela putorius furo TaxID=9669 RepID=M3XVS5_MUSPF|nr:cell division cycle-associated protein 2 isoform X1 [Mustela putorius furo]XP_004763301.1 cell division cycle-associated protein 2 isoform X1 [Mustela putorius furo]
MDSNPKDSERLETKEPALRDDENSSFILGNGNLVTPQKHEPEVTPNGCTLDTFKSPLDFSTVTVEQLGITPESFVKNSSGKSSSYLKKSRRRSTIGARGSPETNHLIRFIAQQRSLKKAEKSPLTPNSPFLGSPVPYRNVNSLRERMSAFQSAFHCIKENENMIDHPEFSEAEGEFKTTGSSKKEHLGGCQESEFPANLSSKRRRISSQSGFDENLTDAVHLQIFHSAPSPDTGKMCAVEAASADFSEKSFESGLTRSGYLVGESVSLSKLTEASSAHLLPRTTLASSNASDSSNEIGPPSLFSSGVMVAECIEGKRSRDAVPLDNLMEVSTDTTPEVRSLVTSQCTRDVSSSETFVLRSVLKKTSVKLFPEGLQEHCDNLCDDGTHPGLISSLANYCKEQKAEGQENCKVPASLNIRKRKRVTFGEDLSPEVFDESLPANTPLRKGGTPVRKRDLSGVSPLLLEQSPVPVQLQLSQPNFDDKGENLENIEPLQVSLAVLSPVNKSSISETLSGTDTFSSEKNHEKIASHKVGRVTRASNRSSQLITFAEENVCNLFNTEAQPCKEKKINRRKSQERKSTGRVLSKKNQGLKSFRKKKAKGKKSVKKSLYGERDLASKKPLLSPIPELPELSEIMPPTPGPGRLCSDDFNSNGELEETKLPKRKNLLPQNPEDLQMSQGFNKYDLSASSSPFTKRSLSLINATLEQDLNKSAIATNEQKTIPKAEIKLEGENGLSAGSESGSGHVSCAPVTAEPLASDDAESSNVPPPRELAAAGQNVENLFQTFKISENVNIKYEKQDDFLIATEGKRQAMPLTSDLKNEEILSGHVKDSKSLNAALGRSSIEGQSGTGVSGREKKHRRHSMCYSDGQSLYLEKTGNHKPPYMVSNSLEIGLENSELYKDLSASIEQTFQRTNSETKVRRSTRLRKDLEDEGLVWISLPFPSTSCTSQNMKRRTICTVDSRGFESLSLSQETASSGQNQSLSLPVSGKENREGFAARASSSSGKRRKSLCTSTLANSKDTAQSKCFKRRTSLSQKGETSLKDFERVGHVQELKQ